MARREVARRLVLPFPRNSLDAHIYEAHNYFDQGLLRSQS